MVKIALFAALALFAATIQAQEPASVAGVVVASTGEPLSGATVTLTKTRAPAEGALHIPGRAYHAQPPSASVVMTTGADGKFIFMGLDSGGYLIRVVHAGYSPGAYGAGRPGLRR